MVGTVQMAAYQQIARMTSNIDFIIQEAINTKSQISNQSIGVNFSNFTGIGKNVNMLA
jgi:hypothetical protein